jgi:heme A synthase
MQHTEGKPERSDSDPEMLARLLEIELMQKRAAWHRAGAQRNTVRMLAFLFLFVVIAGAIAAYFFFFADVSRPNHAHDHPAVKSSSAKP